MRTMFLDQFPDASAHSPNTLLGMEITINESCCSLSQIKLIKKGLETLKLKSCNPVLTPLTPNIQLTPASEQDADAFNQLGYNYRSFTGMLNYLACRTRPDLGAAVLILLQFNHLPGLSHWKQVIHCWKYLKATMQFSLSLSPKADDPNSLVFYSEATWGSDLQDRTSQSGSICFWKSCPIIWNSKKQKLICMSS